MKTKIIYIATLSLLITFSSAFSQDSEGLNGNSSTTNYLAKKKIDIAQSEKSLAAQDETLPSIGNSTQSRLVAAERINYQAVARDAGGVLMANTAVTVDFEIRDGAGGAAVFNETHNLNTSASGVFSTQIGNTNSLANVNWLDIEAWLQVNLNGTDVGETRMGSVPTALHSKNSGAVMIYGSGTSNADKMIAMHSPAFPTWGMGYNDASDDIDFMAGGTKTMRVDLGSGSISTNGDVEVLQTTTAPALNRVYGNSMPIAFGSVALGFNDIQTGYGITSFANPNVGEYDIVLDHDTDMTNCVVLVTPFTGSFGVPEIAGYEPTGANSFKVRIQTVGGVARDSAFTFVVYGNH